MRHPFGGNALAGGVFGLTLLVWFAVEVRQGLQRRPGATNTDRGSLLLVRVAAVAGAVLAAIFAEVGSNSFAGSPAQIVACLGLEWAGIALRLWSFRTLGTYFTFQVMTSAHQQVVTTGPYRFVRHPSYTGILLILAGVGLSYGNVLSLAALIVLPLLGFINRIRIEEAALASALGDRYTTYAAGRKRLIPYVW